MLPSLSLLPTNHFGTDCSACCRRGPYSHQPLRRGPYFTPTTSEPTAHCRGPYFPPTTSEPPAQHVAVAVPIAPINHFGTDCSACCRRGPYFLPTTSEPTAQHVAVAVTIAPINHFGTDCSACCRRGPYFPPTTSEPTAQHVALAVPTSHQSLRNRPLSMLPSRSLLPTNHLGTDCSACCRRGPYFPSTTSEPTAHHIAVAVPTSYQPLRNRPLSMLPSRSLLPTNHLGTDCSACCRRGPYFPSTTSEPTAQHVALAVPTSHQPLRNRLLSMLPSRSLLPPTTSSRSLFHTNHFGTDCSLSRSLLPTNHFGTACSACCRRGPYSSHQPLRNRLLSMLPSRSLLPTNHFHLPSRSL